MIELRNVSLAFDGRMVLRDVDLGVDDGELLVVTGRTGSGKSTLLGVLNGLVPQFSGGALSGDVLIDGVSVLGRAPRELADQVGYVGQDPAAWFVTDTVEEELAFGPEQLGLDHATMRRRVEILDLLGVADLRRRDLRTLSGGQQQRVAIGAVLTMHPRTLVLDEPTSALDPTAAEDVLAILTRLVHDVGLSVVLAEHRLERVVPFADRIGVLAGDGGLEVGLPGPILRTAPVAPPIVELGRLAGWEPLPLTVRDARRAARGDCGLGPIRANSRRGDAVSVRRAAVPQEGEQALAARGIRVSYGHRVALRRVDLDLSVGGITALMGRNGAGKSSLLWAVQGSGPRDAGTVLLSDRARSGRRGGPIGLVPQNPADLLFCESVAEECALADADPGALPDGPRAGQIFERMAPGADPAQHPRDLSEGQRLALVLALVLRTDPAVVLLDEPTRGLDYPGKLSLTTILADLAADGRSVLLATHDVEFVAQVADRVVVLADGEIVADGPTAQVVAQTPAFAPQVSKILGDGWLTVAQVAQELSA